MVKPVAQYLSGEDLVYADVLSADMGIASDRLKNSQQMKRMGLQCSRATKLIESVASRREPQAIIALDSVIIDSVEKKFAVTNKDFERLNNQMNENLDAIRAIDDIRDKDLYKKIVQSSGADIDPNKPPLKNAIHNILDKRIRFLATDLAGIEVNSITGRRELNHARQNALKIAKEAVIELQKEALQEKKKNMNKLSKI